MKNVKLRWHLAWMASLLLFAPLYVKAQCTCAEITDSEIDEKGLKQINQCLSELTADYNSSSIKPDVHKNCVGKLNRAFLRKQILSTPPPAGAADHLVVGQETFDDYLFNFSLGYEFTNINSIFKQGHPRIGLLVHQQFNTKSSIDAHFLLTSSAEQKLDNTGQFQSGSDGAEQALEVEVQPFYAPFSRAVHLDKGNNERTITNHIGFTLVLGGRKTDKMDKLDSREYFGVRSAFNHQTYTDFLVGRTESLKTWRLELRGQMPIFRLANYSRFFIGGILNASIENRSNNDEADVIRIYVQWDSPDISRFF